LPRSPPSIRSQILGVMAKLPEPQRLHPKHILDYVFTQLVRFKKLNQDDDSSIGVAPPGSAAASNMSVSSAQSHSLGFTGERSKVSGGLRGGRGLRSRERRPVVS
jgi:hypothetical protein